MKTMVDFIRDAVKSEPLTQQFILQLNTVSTVANPNPISDLLAWFKGLEYDGITDMECSSIIQAAQAWKASGKPEPKAY